MVWQHIMLVILWIVFGLLHTVLAGGAWKRKMQTGMKQHYKFYRFYYSLFAALSLILLLFYHSCMHSILLWHVLYAEKIIAAILFAAGAALVVFCAREYFLSLSGIDVFLRHKIENKLRDNGLHSIVRHPLYLGTIVLAWSIFLWQPLISNLLSCISVTFYTRIGIYFEEKKLIREFGDEYKQYARKVSMLIPGI